MREHAMTEAAREIDWKKATPPFDPEWRLFGRAVSDDKASIAAVLAAFDALQATHNPPSVNIKGLWEGEEETGSVHLSHALHQHKNHSTPHLILPATVPSTQPPTP